jgi:single-stranded DNA-binding protein
VLIEGRLKLDTWEKDGKKNSKLRVVGERMQMLGGKGESKPQAATTSYKNPNKFQPTGDSDPF